MLFIILCIQKYRKKRDHVSVLNKKTQRKKRKKWQPYYCKYKNQTMIIDGKQKGKQSSYRTEKENKNET